MPHLLEALLPHIPGSTFTGNTIALRPGSDYLRLGNAILIWTSGTTELTFDADSSDGMQRLAAELRDAGIENRLDAE